MGHDNHNGKINETRAGCADTAHRCATINERLRRALPLWVSGTTGVLAGGLIAAAIARAPTSALVWLVAYLVLVVGAAQIALAAGQALLAQPAVGSGLIRLECLLFNLGSASVVGGTLGPSFLFVLLGTLLVLGVLVIFLLTVRRTSTNYLLRLYQGVIAIVALGACIGLGLSGASVTL